MPPISELDVFDIMLDFQNVSGWKFVKLEKIAQATLGTGKSADGIMAVEWWKTGEVDKIIEYCLQDVKVTRDVFLHGLNKGFLEVMKADESKAKFNVNWS